LAALLHPTPDKAAGAAGGGGGDDRTGDGAVFCRFRRRGGGGGISSESSFIARSLSFYGCLVVLVSLVERVGKREERFEEKKKK
jgi:hypothetical protein